MLLLDTESRLLLFEGRDLSDATDTLRWWFTAGGGVNAGESLTEAAHRELPEETGQSGLQLVDPFHRRECGFVNDGDAQRQVEHYFAARTDRTTLTMDGWTCLEQRATTTWRWWPAAELQASDVTFFPENLPDLVRRANTLV